MIKYFLLITVICTYDIIQVFNKGKKIELFILLFLVSLSFWLCYLSLSDPSRASLSNAILALINSDYIEGN